MTKLEILILNEARMFTWAGDIANRLMGSSFAARLKRAHNHLDRLTSAGLLERTTGTDGRADTYSTTAEGKSALFYLPTI